MPLTDDALSRVLVLNGAAAGDGAVGLLAAVADGHVVTETHVPGRGAAESFAPLARTVLNAAGWSTGPTAIVAVIGPGSFTGLRASLALATGLALGYGCTAIGVTLGAALRAMPGADRAVCINVARRNRCFVDFGDGRVEAMAPGDFILPVGTDTVLGDAVAWLEPEQYDGARALPYQHPTALAIVRAMLAHPALPLQPLYIDAPEAKPPRDGLRPMPIG